MHERMAMSRKLAAPFQRSLYLEGLTWSPRVCRDQAGTMERTSAATISVYTWPDSSYNPIVVKWGFFFSEEMYEVQ